MANDLQKTNETTLSLTAISKPADLLACKPIQSQVKEMGEHRVLATIRMAVEKAFIALDILVDDHKMRILCEDLIDVYMTDSIEDIVQALKKGRSGKYGNNYGKLNMIVIREWMAKHLEEKSIIRERELSKKKKKHLEIDSSPIDYEVYKKRRREPKKTNAQENEFQKFRMSYLNGKIDTEGRILNDYKIKQSK